MDGTQVIVAFRRSPLLVWNVNNAHIIGRFKRPSDKYKSKQDPYSDVGPICWNPVSGHVLGIYHDGPVFKWHPRESEGQEHRALAATIQCNSDGALFVTSGIKRGFQVWSFHHFEPIYQLSCHTTTIDIALSPDGRRLYELRESSCNVREPNALIRHAEVDEKSSETTLSLGGSTLLPLTSESLHEPMQPVQALAIGKTTWSYCSGDYSGMVRLSKAVDQTSYEVAQGFQRVRQIVLSNDEHCLAAADLTGRVSVMTIEDSETVPKCPLSFYVKFGTGLQQIVFDILSQYLIVVTTTTVQLWSLESKSLITTKTNTTRNSRWIAHPLNAAWILQCTFTSIRIYQWSDLGEIQSRPLKQIHKQETWEENPGEAGRRRPLPPLVDGPDSDHDAVENVCISQQDSMLLLQTSRASFEKDRIVEYLIIKVEDLTVAEDSQTSHINAWGVPRAVAAKMEKILGFTLQSPRRRWAGSASDTETEMEEVLAFIDYDDWVCSWRVGDDVTAKPDIRRHFFVPQDWLSLDSLHLATVSRDGKFYCPRNGEVAVVSNWLQNEWVD
ncbi:MAG: hypothetical protein Q9169_005451 [Polycauliona sp. 2 TL-2023]